MPEPIARWNAARDVWETGTTGLFCEHSDVFSATFPASGMTRCGAVFPLPPWDAHICAGGSSSLLPTPDATHGRKTTRTAPLLPGVAEQLLPTPTAVDYGNNQSPSPGAAVRPSLSALARTDLLPTPTVGNVTGGNRSRSGERSNELLLPGVARSLLPTPRATDGEKGGPNQPGSSGDLMLPSAVASLLPTPKTSDVKGAGLHGDGGLDLRTAAASLLPTPQARDGDSSGRTMSASTAAKRYAQGKRNLDDAIALLPTPTSTNAQGNGYNNQGKLLLPGVAAELSSMSTGESTDLPSDSTS